MRKKLKPHEYVLEFGKFRGRQLKDCPLGYLMYLATDLVTSRNAKVTWKTLKTRRRAAKCAADALKHRWKQNA